MSKCCLQRVGVTDSYHNDTVLRHPADRRRADCTVGQDVLPVPPLPLPVALPVNIQLATAIARSTNSTTASLTQQTFLALAPSTAHLSLSLSLSLIVRASKELIVRVSKELMGADQHETRDTVHSGHLALAQLHERPATAPETISHQLAALRASSSVPARSPREPLDS